MREGYFQTMYGREARNEAGRFVGEDWIIDFKKNNFLLFMGRKFLWASNGFDREHEAKEASRASYVKWQN